MDNQNQPAQQNSQLSILIVEDDPSLSKMYATKFGKEGFNVLTAMDGASGLSLAAEQHPSVILLDMMLPKYSGIEFLEQLKQHTAMQNTPVIALTNLTENQEKERALKLGAKDYLAKAMHTPDEVVQKVKAHMGMGEQQQTAQPQQQVQSEPSPPSMKQPEA